MTQKYEKFKSLLTNLGAQNKATYAVIAIAAAKGVFRPLFTMCDKKESPQVKKYTALREGLTEVIAIPTYYVGEKIATKIARSLEKNPAKLEIAEKNLQFLSVCLTTLLVIPGLCSVLVRPLTNLIMKDNKNNGILTKVDKTPPLTVQKWGENTPKLYKGQYRSTMYYKNNGMRI